MQLANGSAAMITISIKG